MKISELIAFLEGAKRQFGDIQVDCAGHQLLVENGGFYDNPAKVVFTNEHISALKRKDLTSKEDLVFSENGPLAPQSYRVPTSV